MPSPPCAFTRNGQTPAVVLGDPRHPYVLRALNNVAEPLVLENKYKHDPKRYFEPQYVQNDGPDRWVVLEPDQFYIMKSRERLYIPEDVAVEVVAISERIGDIRIHYAGFAHPNFGRAIRGKGERRGTPLIFEVRATDMKTKLYHGSVLARIQLFRMSQSNKTVTKTDAAKTDSSKKTEVKKETEETETKIDTKTDTIKAGPSDYETQELKLSNVFTETEWPKG